MKQRRCKKKKVLGNKILKLKTREKSPIKTREKSPIKTREKSPIKKVIDFSFLGSNKKLGRSKKVLEKLSQESSHGKKKCHWKKKS